MGDIDTYKMGSKYETFFGRAFNDTNRSKPGAHGTTFTNLVDSENGQSNVKHLGSTQKIADNLKKHMHKAMDKYLSNKKIPDQDRSVIKELKSQIDGSNSSDELFDIVKETVELTQILRNR